MTLGHGTGIAHRAARGRRPEIGDLFEVFRPMLDLRVEDGADDVVLPDICVKMMQQLRETGATADALEQRGSGNCGRHESYCHSVGRKLPDSTARGEAAGARAQ